MERQQLRDRLRRTEESLRSLVGSHLVSVTYYNSDDLWPEGYRLDQRIHEPDAAVCLATVEGEVFLVLWDLVGESELLTVRQGEEAEVELQRTSFASFDAGSIDPWPSLLGQVVVSAEVVKLNSLERYIRMVIGDRVVTFLTGEWDGDRVRVVPNSLLVDFA